MLQTLKKAKAPRLVLTAVIASALLVTGACGQKKETGGDVVATYKGGKVTKKEMETFVNTTNFFYPQFASAGGSPEFQDYMLKQIVTLKVLTGRATSESKKETEDKVKEQMKQMEDYFNSQGKDALDKQLSQAKITKKDVEDYMRNNILVITDMDKKVTEQQLKDDYDKKLKEDPHAFDVASVSHILVGLKDPSDQTGQKDLRTKEEALKRAQEAKQKIDNGADFAAVAKEYSDDPGSKDNGGKYENEKLATTQWDPAFKQAAINQPVGKVGDPFESSFGYHIMKVDKRDAEAFDTVKNDLRSELAQTLITDFMTKELPTLDFKNNLPAPSPSPAASGQPSVSPSPSAPAATDKK